MGIKTRMAPMSAALGCVMLRRLPQTNAVRNHNHLELSDTLEKLGFDCFLPPNGVERVYFEFLIRHRNPEFDTVRLLQQLQDNGLKITSLHQQPFFTEGKIAKIGRYPSSIRLPEYAKIELPRTQHENARLIKLPNFCWEDTELIDHYATIITQVMKDLPC
jgi:dTDP-4-amino-4,6-dideoxygalactose transaminase